MPVSGDSYLVGNGVRSMPLREKENGAEAEVRPKSAPKWHHVILYTFVFLILCFVEEGVICNIDSWAERKSIQISCRGST
jgi:hypothetical protein